MLKKRLNILGLSYSQTQTGAYALVLAEEDGNRRIPIIIGAAEAQAIAIQLEGLKPIRPLTHDLFLAMANSFHISLVEVNIYKLEEGIFYSELVCKQGKTREIIDSRTSDSIALALRFRCPIYTTEEILKKAGIMIEIEEDEKSGVVDADTLKRYSTEALEEMLQHAISTENYEHASEIRDEIKRRASEK